MKTIGRPTAVRAVLVKATLAYRLIVAIAVTMALTACSRDSGPLDRQARDVAEFSGIDIEGGSRLEITVGQSQAVHVEAPRSVLDDIQTEVRDGTLLIRSRPRSWVMGRGHSRITVQVSVPHLNSLRLAGGHRASIDGFAGGASTIKIEGAAELRAVGQLDELTVHLAGAGTADLSELAATKALVTVDGVGRVLVHPTEVLDATMNGVGAIHYVGSPREVRTRMNGLGSIGRLAPDAQQPDEELQPELDPDQLQPEYEEHEQLKKGGETEVI